MNSGHEFMHLWCEVHLFCVSGPKTQSLVRDTAKVRKVLVSFPGYRDIALSGDSNGGPPSTWGMEGGLYYLTAYVYDQLVKDRVDVILCGVHYSTRLCQRLIHSLIHAYIHDYITSTLPPLREELRNQQTIRRTPYKSIMAS